MIRQGLSRANTLVFACAMFFLGGCIWILRDVEVEPVNPAQPPAVVTSSLKIHLKDGSTALFPKGGTFFDGRLRGTGTRYGLDVARSAPIDELPLDSIAALETYRTDLLEEKSILVSLLTTGSLAALPFLAVAVFGSCPTVYSGGGSGVLEAESFSNSIAPLLEMRDVDRLGAQPNADGLLSLEVRNEALETHYINHLELVEAVHAEGELAVPGRGDRIRLLRDLTAPATARDRAGRDVSESLRAADGAAFSTAALTLERAHAGDLTDHIDLVLPAPRTDTAAVFLRLRNSLLNTVLFYDFMLAAQGPQALDWLGKELETVATAVELGDFHAKRMGLRVQVWENGAYREIERVPDVGPIAWSDVGVPVPVPPGDSLRIRLSFVADGWRIDQALVAAGVEEVSGRRIPLRGVFDADEKPDGPALERLSAAEGRYHVTSPGRRFRIEFETGRADTPRTFFLAAQGYYTEWIRGDWVRTAPRVDRFVAGDETLFQAMTRWKSVKNDYEQRFEATKIPVR